VLEREANNLAMAVELRIPAETVRLIDVRDRQLTPSQGAIQLKEYEH